MEDEDLRLLLAERLAIIGKFIGTAEAWGPEEAFNRIVPKYKRDLFRICLVEARKSILEAMDIMMPKESPTTETIVNILLERYRTLTEPEKERVVGTLREAFRSENALWAKLNPGEKK